MSSFEPNEASVDQPTGPPASVRDAPVPEHSKPVSRFAGYLWLAKVLVQAVVILGAGTMLILLVGVAQRTGWIQQTEVGSTAETASGGGDKRYICPMMCTPPSTQPGRCPVCAMELVEATSGGGGDGISVTIEASARRMIGIQTATSKISFVERTIRTIGSIDFDESRLANISAYVDGRLEKMYADYVGVPVNAGDDLALIYSPQLYSAQTEYLLSLDGGSIGRLGGNNNLLEMARENLSELGMTEDQIATLGKTRQAQSRIRIKSPQSGTVIQKTAVEGDYVKTGEMIYRIADLTSVWLMLDLFPDDAAAVRFGQQVEAEIQSVPGDVFTGRVAFKDPTVDPQTRTVRVRVEVMNFDGKLRPGDYATARISVPAIPRDLTYDPALAGKFISPMHPQIIRTRPGDCPICGMDLIPTSDLGFSSEPLPEQQVVTVPRDAVLMAGGNSVIYVETEPGRFEIRRVAVGVRTDTEAVIVEGLAAGETVATSGNFLIDSQMQLAGNPSLLDPSRATSYPPGPLELPQRSPLVLTGEAGEQLDRTYDAYVLIQNAMAADSPPPPAALSTMIDGLSRLVMMPEVPDQAQKQFDHARRAAMRMDGSLQTAREAFRIVSHALLKAASVTRGPQTAQKLVHYYCPMVPGGGGDWMQSDGELANPYWGSEMLRCGEMVRDMAVESALDSIIEPVLEPVVEPELNPTLEPADPTSFPLSVTPDVR